MKIIVKPVHDHRGRGRGVGFMVLEFYDEEGKFVNALSVDDDTEATINVEVYASTYEQVIVGEIKFAED